jgi:hypothetical protein
MKHKRLGNVSILVLLLIAVLYLAAYIATPSLLVKESETSLIIEDSIVFTRDKSKGVGVSVIGHSYEPPGIREFVSRVYHFVPGYRLERRIEDVTSIRTKNIFFINRSEKDRISPVAAEFTVNWRVEGRSKERVVTIESGEFSGKTVDTSLPEVPSEWAHLKESSWGEKEVILNFTDADNLLVEGDEGTYTLEMKSEVEYTFSSWSGSSVSNKKNYSVFTAEISYYNGSHENMILYFPPNSLTEELSITHPLVVRAKQLFRVIN